MIIIHFFGPGIVSSKLYIAWGRLRIGFFIPFCCSTNQLSKYFHYKTCAPIFVSFFMQQNFELATLRVPNLRFQCDQRQQCNLKF